MTLSILMTLNILTTFEFLMRCGKRDFFKFSLFHPPKDEAFR